MTLLPQPADRVRTSVSILAVPILALTAMCAASAQAPPPQAKPAPTTVETIRLTHVTAQRDFNDLQTALRNMLPTAAIYASQTQNALAIRGTAEDIETAKKVVADLDRPRKAWRVTYTFSDIENGKPAGVHHLSLLVVAGEKTIVKHGNRVPILTGMFEKEPAAQTSQFQYLDVGLNVEATLDGDRLHSKLEQSNVSDEKSGFPQDPIVGQTVLEATSDLKPGKTSALGSIDIPGTSHRQDIEVVAEEVQIP